MEIFKKISIGGITKEQLMTRLLEAGIQFNAYAHTLFQHPSFSFNETIEKMSLVKLKIADLQMTEPCFFPQIIKKAQEVNLQLCPLVLGAFLRLDYLNQPEGPYLTIASLKPESNEDFPNGFYIRNFEGKLWLRGYKASDDYAWPIDSEFIFIRKS